MHAYAGFSRRVFALALTLVLAAGLGACSSEATERKNFIEFLQTRIIDKPGLNVPRLTPQDEKALGEYTSHFAVIRDFNGALDSKVATPMRTIMAKGMPRTIPELMSRRADLATMRSMSATLRTGIDAELSKADAARAALRQPDDLKPVYDKAYARTVTEPAAAVKEVLPAVEEVLVSAEKLAAHLDANKDSVKISGSTLQISDPKVLAEANVLMQQMGEKSNEIVAAQRRMSTLMTGR